MVQLKIDQEVGRAERRARMASACLTPPLKWKRPASLRALTLPMLVG